MADVARSYRGSRKRPGAFKGKRGLVYGRGRRNLRTYPQSGIETKYFDTSLAATALVVPPASAAWTGLDTLNPTTVLCFNAPQQGTGASNRDGRVITMQSLQVNFVVNVPSQVDQTGADSQCSFNYAIVLDKQTNSGTATGLDSENVYTNPVASALGGINPLRNMLYTKRYKVLKTESIQAPQMNMTYDGTNVEQEGGVYRHTCYIPLKAIKTEFIANAGTVADISTNGLFLLAWTTGSSQAPTLTYNARLRFRG